MSISGFGCIFLACFEMLLPLAAQTGSFAQSSSMNRSIRIVFRRTVLLPVGK